METPESIKLEIIWKSLSNVQNLINMFYKDKKNYKFTDEKMEKYYYKLNDMCLEILDRKQMDWQKEEENGQKS